MIITICIDTVVFAVSGCQRAANQRYTAVLIGTYWRWWGCDKKTWPTQQLWFRLHFESDDVKLFPILKLVG